MSGNHFGAVSAAFLLAFTTSGTALADPVPVAVPPGVTLTYSPLLSDEFSGTSYPVGDEGGVDATKWAKTMSGWWPGRWPSYFMPANSQVAGGSAQVILNSGGLPTPPPTDPTNGAYTYSTGVLRSRYATAYGYYEARVQTANVAGDSAFWLSSNTVVAPSGNELDVVECYGTGSPNVARMSAHYPVSDGHGGYTQTYDTRTWTASTNLSADYHVYGLCWTPTTITWYIDGVQRYTHANTCWNQPLYVLFDLETQLSACGTPAANTLPATMNVDYFRYWSIPSVSVLVTPEPSTLFLLVAGGIGFAVYAGAAKARRRPKPAAGV